MVQRVVYMLYNQGYKVQIPTMKCFPKRVPVLSYNHHFSMIRGERQAKVMAKANSNVLVRAIQSHSEPFRAIQSHSEPFRAIQSHSEPFRANQLNYQSNIKSVKNGLDER